MRFLALPLVLLLALPAWLDPVAATHVPCDPYPVGYCGAFDGERVTYCWVMVGGRFVDATEPTFLAIIVPATGEALYVRTGPLWAFAADPLGAWPRGTLHRETNGVAGLQPRPFTCAAWVWFDQPHVAEPAQWMGPFDSQRHPADDRLA